MTSLNISDIAIINSNVLEMYVKEINIKNRVYKYYFDNLIRAGKIETKNI